MGKNKKEQQAATGNEVFEYGDSKYEILVHAAHIKGHEKLTALEIATNPEAQEILVKSNSGIIRKIV
jgi:hypothetical protein